MYEHTHTCIYIFADICIHTHAHTYRYMFYMKSHRGIHTFNSSTPPRFLFISEKKYRKRHISNDVVHNDITGIHFCVPLIKSKYMYIHARTHV